MTTTAQHPAAGGVLVAAAAAVLQVWLARRLARATAHATEVEDAASHRAGG
jgi:hypothetical protein